MPISYSDGVEIEGKILRLLNETHNLRSSASIGAEHYDEYAVRYHLSSERSNLLRHFNFEGLDVLELGAGMGAISRYLSEHCNSLTAVEGAELRHQALQSRLKDLNNWKSVCTNIQDYTSSKKFDVVCLIGVLEYSELYIDGEGKAGPHQTVLRHAYSLLKEGGVLLLAIENRHGLKYWSGAPEDHTGRIFDGICGYSPEPSPRTFSRPELLGLIRDSGYEQVEEFYPWPDYKLPITILSDQFVQREPLVSGEMASDAIEKGLQDGPRYFPDSLAILELSARGHHGDFANSFLFACCKSGGSQVANKLFSRMKIDNELAWHYAVGRRSPAMTVVRESAGELFSQKRINGGKDGLEIQRRLGQEPLLRGPRLSSYLARLAYYGERDRYWSELRRFLQWSFNTWAAGNGALSPEALDAGVTNTVLIDGEYEQFDLEWQWHEPVSRSWFILRNVVALRHAWQMDSDPQFETLQDAYLGVCEFMGVKPDLDRDLDNKAKLHSRITGTLTYDDVMTEFTRLLDRRRPGIGFAREPDLELRTREGAEGLAARNAELDRELQRLKAENHHLGAQLTRKSVRVAMFADKALRSLPGVNRALHAVAKLRRR